MHETTSQWKVMKTSSNTKCIYAKPLKISDINNSNKVIFALTNNNN